MEETASLLDIDPEADLLERYKQLPLEEQEELRRKYAHELLVADEIKRVRRRRTAAGRIKHGRQMAIPSGKKKGKKKKGY